jgi:FkbM family methyltransferase
VDVIGRQPAPHRWARRWALGGARGARLAWRLADRLARWPSEALADVWPGLPVVVDHRDYIASEIYRGFYEREVVRLIDGIARPGGIAVDVGANVGYHTTLLARAVGPNGQVLAFEPHPANARRLASLLEAAELSNVVLSTQAVGSTSGTANLALVDETSSHSGLASLRAGIGSGHDAVEVEVVALDEVGALVGVEVDVLKVDVEGFEEEVLIGAASLLRDGRVRHLILEVSPNFGSIAYAGRMLRASAGRYAAFVIAERGRVRRRLWLRPVSEDDIDRLRMQSNVLVSRRDAVGALSAWIRPS